MAPRLARPRSIQRGTSGEQAEQPGAEGHVTVQELMLENRRRRTHDFASRRRIGVRLRDNADSDDSISAANTVPLPPRGDAIAEEAQSGSIAAEPVSAQADSDTLAVRSNPTTEEERSAAAQAEVDQMVAAIKEIFRKDDANGDSDGSDDVELAMAKLLSLGLINSRPTTPAVVEKQAAEPSVALTESALLPLRLNHADVETQLNV